MSEKTVLVIEDDTLNTKLVKAILTGAGFRVVSAENAEKGLQLLQSEKPHLVLMDVKLPGMDGLTATRLIKADPVMAGIPIVAFTAYAMEGDIQKALDAGCSAVITKPIDLKTFIAKVRSLML